MLAELIPKIAAMDQEQWKYKPRPSNAGPERCLRSMVYNALDIPPKPLPGRSLLIMDDSSWHETLTIDWIQKSIYKVHSAQMGLDCLYLPDSPFLKEGYVCKMCNQKREPGWVHGHIDGIVMEPDGTEHLFEHKAISTRSFEMYVIGDVVPYDYICQTVLYEIALRKLLNKDLSYSILLVKNKNTAQYMEYHISYDDQEDVAQIEINIVVYEEGLPKLHFVREAYMEKVVQGTMDKYGQVDKYFLERKLPLRSYTPDNWHCSYCRWSEYCLKEYEEEMQKRLDMVELENGTIEAVIDLKTNISPERLRLAKKEEKIKVLVQSELMMKNGKAGLAGAWLACIEPSKSTKLDKDLIPEDVLKKATKVTPTEKLTFKKIEKEAKPIKKKERIIGSSGPKEK